LPPDYKKQHQDDGYGDNGVAGCFYVFLVFEVVVHVQSVHGKGICGLASLTMWLAGKLHRAVHKGC
jgi:hypothetical protein